LGFNWKPNYFSTRKCLDRFHELVDRWCFRSAMDPRTERGRSSPERSPCGATGHQSSPRRRGEGEGDGAELTEAKIGRCGGEVVPAAKSIRVWRRCLVWSKRRHGEAKQGAAQVVVWCHDVIGVFYSLGEAVEERGGVSRWWIFNSTVSTLNQGEESMRRRASAGG
jgi:hypothetical protein